MVLAVTSGLPFWNLPPHLYPCCSFSAWSILPINLLGKSYSALSQDPNTTSWEGFSCVSWITGHSLFNSQYRQERQCSDYIYLLVCSSDSSVDWKIFKDRCLVCLYLCNPSTWQSVFHMVCAFKVFTDWMSIFCGMNHRHDFILPVHLIRFLMFIPFRCTFLYISDICLSIFFNFVNLVKF